MAGAGAIFKDDADRELFVETLEQACRKTGWQESIIAQEMKKPRRKPGDLERRPKGHPKKVRMAARLRRETTTTLKWIVQRLHMGTWTNLNNHLYLAKRNQTCKV